MQYIITDDPDTGLHVIEGAKGSDFVTIVELTVTGFPNGTENIDWEIIDKITPQ